MARPKQEFIPAGEVPAPGAGTARRSRAQIVDAVFNVYDRLGGEEWFAGWAALNESDFCRLFLSKTLPAQTLPLEGDAKNEIVMKFAIQPTALDSLPPSDD